MQCSCVALLLLDAVALIWHARERFVRACECVSECLCACVRAYSAISGWCGCVCMRMGACGFLNCRLDYADGSIQVGCEWVDGEREFGSVPLPNMEMEADTLSTSIFGLSLQGNPL
jgi:hypothetical protein